MTMLKLVSVTSRIVLAQSDKSRLCRAWISNKAVQIGKKPSISDKQTRATSRKAVANDKKRFDEDETMEVITTKQALDGSDRSQEKSILRSYLEVCVHVGQIQRASLILRSKLQNKKDLVDVSIYNLIIMGWARLGSLAQIVETRMTMMINNVEPNTETFAYILLAYTKNGRNMTNEVKKLVTEMQLAKIDPSNIFKSTYINYQDRVAIRSLLAPIITNYREAFFDVPVEPDCKLLNPLNMMPSYPYEYAGDIDLSELENWADFQRVIENRSSIAIKSIVDITRQDVNHQARFGKLWKQHYELWHEALGKALDENLNELQVKPDSENHIHIYPYLCSIDKKMLVHMMLDEVQNNATFTSHSASTRTLHMHFGERVMIKYFREKAIADGSHHELQRIYNDYLKEFCRDPELSGRMNSREYIQKRAIKTQNYAIYKHLSNPVTPWPTRVCSTIGKLLYRIILREVKFDPESVRQPNRPINPDNLVSAFYTAYFQINCTHKIKEEFRAHQEFEKFYQKCCASRLKFDYSYLPCLSPPMPWVSSSIGGYLTTKTELVRMSGHQADIKENSDDGDQKLYPSLDSLNAVGLCPWIVNKEILDLIIGIFRDGGDMSVKVPHDESKMKNDAPALKFNATKAEKILYTKEKKKHDQKQREMFSLWRDCLYRLSIANHFRDRIFWFPHNMDFRGRTYPVPPHFNHLGADLARSLLLFAKGRPLGPTGLDWLKIHLVNLIGTKKSCSNRERLEYANSILHTKILDSADNPLDGHRWWKENDNPWQVLACCKEIAKAIRSKDHTVYVSHFPVHQDGSCNGLQHYAALGRDVDGAAAVNLTPNDKPQDVYMGVVNLVEKIRQRDAAAGHKIAQKLEGMIQRKVIKQTVMTTVYGVTRYGARQQIARQLASRDMNENQLWPGSHYLVCATFESIGQMFNKSRMIQDWFTECAHIIATHYRKPVSWETPLGFSVIQPYSEPYTLNSRLYGPSITDSSKRTGTRRLLTSKQRTAFPPNYIHSLDSSHMMLTSLFCQKEGVTFVSVHDCYWTHPSTVDVMNRVCREQFVALHREPLLQQLSRQFIEKFCENSCSRTNQNDTHCRDKFSKVLGDDLIMTSSKGDSKIRSVFSRVPETGDLDINLVLESTYFFS